MSWQIEGQTLHFQLYVNPDRGVARRMVEQVRIADCKILLATSGLKDYTNAPQISGLHFEVLGTSPGPQNPILA